MLIKPNLISAMNNTGRAMDVSSERLSTGKRINSAKDDPLGFNRVAITKTSISQTGVAINVLEHGMARLDARDQTLSSIQDVTARFQELSTMASAGLYKLTDILPEMKSLEQAMMSLANSKDASGYMFAGTANNAPFATDPATGAVMYMGSTTPQTINVEGITMSGSVDGSPMLGVFTAMRNVITSMEAGTPPATTDVQNVANGMETVLSMRTNGAAEGAAANQVLNSLGLRHDRERSEVDRIESADETTEMMNLTQGQKQYEAILKVMSMHINQRRLMDYI